MSDRNNGTLRQASKEDITAIRALTRAAYAKWVPLIGREPMPMTADYEFAIRTYRFDLLEQSSVLVALIETILRPDHLWIENLAVSPEKHGQGLGQYMLLWIEEFAASLGRTDIKLLTNPAFTGNIEFYKRAGFVIEREEEFKGGVIAYLTKGL